MKDKTTIELVNLLTKAINEGNQLLVNEYALQLTARLYVPKKGYSFDDILYGFGYREIEKQDDKQITIDEYMRSRKNDNK